MTRNWDVSGSEVFLRNPSDDPLDQLKVQIPTVTGMVGDLKVSQTNRVFESTWQYNKRFERWSERLTGGAAITTAGQKDATYLKMTTTTASGDFVEFQTKHFMPYQPYRTHEVTLACIFGPTDVNCKKRVGQITAFNGWCFEKDGTTEYVVIRNNTNQVSGTVETRIARANWNVDKFDGTGPSGLNLNFENGLTYVIEFVWHGTQGIRFGINYFDRLYYCHEYRYSGTAQIPFARTALLPVKVEMENTGTLSAADTMYLGPVSFNISSGEQASAVTYAGSTGVTGVSVTTARTPLIALRPIATVNGSNNRAFLIPENFEVWTSASIFYEVAVLCTGVTATWTQPDANSVAEVGTAITASTIGRIVRSGFVSGNSKSDTTIIQSFEADVFCSLDALNSNTPLTLVIYATKVGGNATSYAALRWREIY